LSLVSKLQKQKYEARNLTEAKQCRLHKLLHHCIWYWQTTHLE